MTTENRKRGRPTLSESKKKSIVIRARVTQEEHEHIKRVAKQKGLTVTQLILLGVMKIEEETKSKGSDSIYILINKINHI